MTTVSAGKAAAQLDQLLETVCQGNDVVITVGERPVARLVRMKNAGKRRRAGSAKGFITIRKDFDEPLEDFSDYMQ